jgi:Fic family protein
MYYFCGMALPLHTYLKNKRADQGLKMREVVAMTGIDQALISKFENGSRIPTDDQIISLAKCFEIPYNELKKYQLVEKVYEILANEPYGYEAFMAAEPRIEYLATKNIADQVYITPDVDAGLKRIDALKEELQTLKFEKDIHLQKVEDHFALRFTYESNKIEGNTLTLSETMMVVKEGITISGKSVNEHLEALNHSEAIDLLYDFVDRKIDFSEYVLLQFHGLILRGINRANAGKYRNVNVRILGAEHIPPEPYLISKLMEEYFDFYKTMHKSLHPVLLAAEMHERLVTIHPFIDGNGRTSRLVMNLILLMHSYPLAILKGDQSRRLRYFRALESVQIKGEPEAFYLLVIEEVTKSLEEKIHLLKPEVDRVSSLTK